MPGYDTTTRWGRFRTYLSYLWNDHAYLRLGFKNDHWISPELVRSNQPWPHQLAAWKKQVRAGWGDVRVAVSESWVRPGRFGVVRGV
mgnify:CR=1 FL=1